MAVALICRHSHHSALDLAMIRSRVFEPGPNTSSVTAREGNLADDDSRGISLKGIPPSPFSNSTGVFGGGSQKEFLTFCGAESSCNTRKAGRENASALRLATDGSTVTAWRLRSHDASR
jgi:hypothetical protein